MNKAMTEGQREALHRDRWERLAEKHGEYEMHKEYVAARDGGTPDEASRAYLRWLQARQTLEELGTPWAEYYRGSGRPTGRLAEEPVYQANGDVAPAWGYVGDMTEEAFYADFEEQEHDSCHTPDRADWRCPFCQDAGWA